MPAFFFFVIYFTSLHVHSISVRLVQLLGSLAGLFSFPVTLKSNQICTHQISIADAGT